MPVRQGHDLGSVLQSGQITNGLSDDLNDYGFVEWNPSAFYVCNRVEYDSGSQFSLLIASSYATSKVGYKLQNWGDDFYDRIYVTPTFIDFGTIASPQTRPVELWNAWRSGSPQLASIDITGTPVLIEGPEPPLSLRPLEFLNYTIFVNSTGAPNVNAQIQFEFSNVQDPLPILVLGTRAVRFGIIPEIPVVETWTWLTDVMVSKNGTEQRHAVRGPVPRVEMDFTAIFTKKSELEEFNAQLLTSVGRLWIPEYQYAVRTTLESAQGAFTLYLNTDATDIRAEEYILIATKTDSFLVEVESVGSGMITVVSALPIHVPVGAYVVPGAPCILPDGSGVNRYAVDHAQEVNIRARLQRYRTSLTRPGAPETAVTFLGIKVLDRRPSANDLVDDNVYTGQEDLDNETGIIEIISDWIYSRIGGTREFKVDRVNKPEEFDYWREMLSFARGQSRMFWCPTYRQDLQLIGVPGGLSNNALFAGADYATKLWSLPTHKFLEFVCPAGTHRVRVTSAVDVEGNSGVSFEPEWPTGPGWDVVERVSLLLPVRLGDDKVVWTHYANDSFLELTLRTAEPPQ